MRKLTNLKIKSNCVSGAGHPAGGPGGTFDRQYGSHDNIGSSEVVFFDLQPGQTVTGWTATLTDLPCVSTEFLDTSIYSDLDSGTYTHYIQPTYNIKPL